MRRVRRDRAGCSAWALALPWALVLSTTQAAWALDPPQRELIDVGERTPLAFVLTTPTGAPARTRSSDLIRLIDIGARTHTSLALRSADDALAQGCRGRLLCLVLRLRPDYERDTLREGSRVRPYADHLQDLAARGVAYPRHLLLVTNVTREGQPDRLSAQLIDTDRALRAYHEASRDDEYWEADVEAAINEDAPSSPSTEVSDLRAAEDFVTALFERHLRPSLETGGVWSPFGAIDLDVGIAGISILLDGQTVGVTAAGGTRLVGVLPGSRSLQLEGLEVGSAPERVEVVRGAVVQVTPDLEARATGSYATTHLVLEIAGAAAVVAGGVALAVAAGTPDNQLRTYCVEGLLPGCSSSTSFATSGYDPTLGAQPNGAGVQLAPLGVGLLVGGLAWGAGTLLFVDEGDLPWIPLLVGAVAGGATFAVMSAAGSGGFAD